MEVSLSQSQILVNQVVRDIHTSPQNPIEKFENYDCKSESILWNLIHGRYDCPAWLLIEIALNINELKKNASDELTKEFKKHIKIGDDFGLFKKYGNGGNLRKHRNYVADVTKRKLPFDATEDLATVIQKRFRADLPSEKITKPPQPISDKEYRKPFKVSKKEKKHIVELAAEIKIPVSNPLFNAIAIKNLYPLFASECHPKKCFYCDEPLQRANKSKDHVHPKRKGGQTLGNTVPCCTMCNSLKGSKSLHSWLFYLESGNPTKYSPLKKEAVIKKLKHMIEKINNYTGL